MDLKKERPSRANGTNLGVVYAHQHSTSLHPIFCSDPQDPAAWITRRVPVTLRVARHIAEINGLGGSGGNR